MTEYERRAKRDGRFSVIGRLNKLIAFDNSYGEFKTFSFKFISLKDGSISRKYFEDFVKKLKSIHNFMKNLSIYNDFQRKCTFLYERALNII